MRQQRQHHGPRTATGHRRWTLVSVLIAVIALSVSGCADFSEAERQQSAGTFSTNDVPAIMPPQSPRPQPPTTDDTGPPPTGPCVDPSPQVIATCLASTGGIHPADDQGTSVYAAERTTGQIFIAKRYTQRVIASVAVDGSGDGGLIDFALSPTYAQDQLIFALITTGEDNRVVSIAPGDQPKPVLTGIPKSTTGNMGSMYFRSPTELIVATGNANNPQLAADPGSLAGKILAVDPAGNGRPRVLAGGFGSNVALCEDAASQQLYAADSGAPGGDRLFAIEDAGPKLLWRWENNPGVAGCAVAGDNINVSMSTARRIDTLALPTRNNPTVGTPTEIPFADTFGALGRMTASAGGAAAQVATVNRSTPQARVVSTDDRVFIFFPTPSVEDRA